MCDPVRANGSRACQFPGATRRWFGIRKFEQTKVRSSAEVLHRICVPTERNDNHGSIGRGWSIYRLIL